MSLEDMLAANTAALEANTKVQTEILAKITSGGGGKTTTSTASTSSKTDDDADSGEPEMTAAEKKKAEAAEKRKAAAAKKKADEAAAKKKAEAAEKAEDIAPRVGIDAEGLRELARKHGSNDGGDKDERERLKGLMASGFDRLGAKKISDLDDEDRVKFAHYLDHWIADNEQELDFEALDEIALAAIEAGGGGGDDDDDDMMG